MQKGRNDREIITDRHRGRLVSHWCCCKTLGGLNHCNTVYHVLVGGIDGLSITSIIAELTAAAISYDLTNDVGISSSLAANLASCGKLLIILLIQHCPRTSQNNFSRRDNVKNDAINLNQLLMVLEVVMLVVVMISLIVIETLRTTKGKNQASNITLRSFLVASGNSPAWLSPFGDFALGFHQIDGQKL
ncbi:hypothetical protein FXO38_20572 [Capsicum annuum]|nr:hypothetical protein FXO38_20572 [Capsicum annuum]